MREINLNASMNDNEFKEKCRRSSFIMLDKFIENLARNNVHSDEAIALSLLYMVSKTHDSQDEYCENASAIDEQKFKEKASDFFNNFFDNFESTDNSNAQTFSSKEKSSCSFCTKDKQKIIDNGSESVFIDIKGKMITLERKVQYSNMSKPVNSVIGSFPIAYCPVCGRKL